MEAGAEDFFRGYFATDKEFPRMEGNRGWQGGA